MSKIQGGALGREQAGGRALDAQDEPAGLHAVAVVREQAHAQGRVRAREDAGRDFQTADHEVLSRIDHRPAAMPGGKDGAAREIAQPGVLLQGQVDQVFGTG